ncbi:hypothetical protein L1049_014007 [Liquidambar formosana]|uniref:non-specific serine/threonine protein kinase n=1 Tax=Liquidambar formosana TaxID=63359 RepID=A0AAP0RLJ1_LIQFO
MFMLLLLSSFLNQASLSSIDPITFSFPSFNPQSCSNGDLICMGSVTAGDHYLNLTPESAQETNTSVSSLPINKVGRVVYPHRVLAWPAIISTTFTVRISPFPNSTGSGEGIAFVIAQDSNPSPNDSYGSYIGLLDRSTQGGVVHQLAVELDTFANEFDPDDNHIGIDTTSIINPVAAKSLNSTGINLKSGRDIKVKIDYDGWKKILHIYVAYSGNPLMSFLNQSIMMSDTVPSSVYVGFTASTGTASETHQIFDWSFTSMPLPDYSLKHKLDRGDEIKIMVIIVIPIIVGLFVLVAWALVPFVCRAIGSKNERNRKNEDIESRSRSAANVPKMFTYKQLSKATHNFSKDNLLGTGGFGSVYKGIISHPPSTIAVKKISATSKQGEKEYLAEICTIGCLRHKNIVQLQGWSHEGEHLLLVYEYMPNSSLDHFIGKIFLDWTTRYKILTGLASALLYLHEECANPVVHRDVKPNNVMLDSDYNAHLGDFGLARLLQNDASVTTMLAGTPGYLAPEVGYSGRATPASDVYSFGMVVLEVVCGRRSKGMMEENSLVDYVWGLHGKGTLLQCVDRMLQGRFEEEQVKRTLIVGLACLHPDSSSRPRIRRVVQIFMNPNEPLMELPGCRPSAIYVSLQSSAASTTTTDFGSTAVSALCRSAPLPDETVIQYGM